MSRIDDPSRFDQEAPWVAIELASAIGIALVVAIIIFVLLESLHVLKTIFLLPPANL